MTILSENKVNKFREKLYHKRVSKLLQKGGKGLNPLEKYKRDEKGRPVISTGKIIRFFSKEMEQIDARPDQYFISLFHLLTELTKGAEPFVFECGFSVSEKDIQESDNKTTIEQLTKNLIITYFSNVKDYKGRVDAQLLTPDLSRIIQKSNAGRDYRTLVGNTLKKLVNSLAQEKEWREYLEDISDVDLVCRLTGAKLPTMDKTVLSTIILKSRKEINQHNILFDKILNTRELLADQEKNEKKYLKGMQRLDEATRAVLKKIEQYLFSARKFMAVIGISSEVLLGKTGNQLKFNLTRIFLGMKPEGKKLPDILAQMGYATARYRLNLLFNYPEITIYCREFKRDAHYQQLYLDLFRLLYRELAEKMNRLGRDADEAGIRLLKQSLVETHRAVDHLAMETDFLSEEKQTVRDAFVRMIGKTPFHHLAGVLAHTETVCQATQDRERQILAQIRFALLESCFETLKQYARDGRSADSAKNGIKKRLHYYAVHYKPQRAFYQLFFERYVARSGGVISPHLSDYLKDNKHFVFAVFMLFSDEQVMKDLIPKEMMENAGAVLAQLRKKQ